MLAISAEAADRVVEVQIMERYVEKFSAWRDAALGNDALPVDQAIEGYFRATGWRCR
jgi:hypothetical protein